MSYKTNYAAGKNLRYFLIQETRKQVKHGNQSKTAEVFLIYEIAPAQSRGKEEKIWRNYLIGLASGLESSEDYVLTGLVDGMCC